MAQSRLSWPHGVIAFKIGNLHCGIEGLNLSTVSIQKGYSDDRETAGCRRHCGR